MPVDIEIRGAEQLGSVAAAFKAAGGGGGLRRELLRNIRSEAKPLVEAAREGAQKLPQSGGLAALVAASKFSTRTRLSGGVGVRLVGTSEHDIDAMDHGTVRHPVYGHGRWVQQSVTPGWFTDAMKGAAPGVRTGVVQAVETIARRIEGAA